MWPARERERQERRKQMRERLAAALDKREKEEVRAEGREKI